MNKRQTIACSIFGKTARYLSVVLALTSLLVAGARSQGGMPPTPPVTDTLTEGTTPLGMAPGAPDGSFELSGFDNANLYNGNLNFALPLVHVGGRGSAGMAVTLALNTKRWNITHISCPGPGCNPQFADAYIPTDQPWEPVMPGYGPGVMIARNEAPNTGSCATTALTRLTFVEPDGTEHEFRDTLTHGEPWPVVGAGPSGTTCVGKDRGATFESFDGSAMTFFSCDPSGNPQSIADTSTSGPFGVSGFMTLRDGTTYRIDVGQVQWIRDRNGNVVTCNYSPTVGLAGITDSLGRQVTFTYADQTSSDPHDTITYPGFGGATRTVTVHHAPLASVLRADFPQTIPTYEGLFPSPYIATGQYNPGDMVASVDLPEPGRSYKFFYNPYGEVARVELPTGGAYEYDYTTVTLAVRDSPSFMFYRRLTERRVYPNGGTGGAYAEKMDYLIPVTKQTGNASDGSAVYQTTVEVDHYGATGSARLAAENHFFNGDPQQAGASYPAFAEGKEFQTDTLDFDGSTVLRTHADDWQQTPVSWWGTLDPLLSPSNDPFIADSTETLKDANLAAQQVFSYDQFRNVTDESDYDYTNNGKQGVLLRHTHTDYITDASYIGDSGTHIRNLPALVTVDGGGGVLAQTQYVYDAYSGGVLDDRANITGHDSSYTTTFLARGNPTSIKRGLGADATTASMQYDIAGNVTSVTDGLGNKSTIDYTDDFGAPDSSPPSNNPPPGLKNGRMTFAFPTKVTNPLGQTILNQYDYRSGKAVKQQDRNGVIATVNYLDPLDRPTELIRAVNQSAVETQTTISYDDAANTITTSSDLNSFGDNVLSSSLKYDGLGRTIETDKSAPEGTIVTTQSYDGMGRVATKTNPYIKPTDSTYGTVSTAYDALSRVVNLTTLDQSGASTGVVTTAYSGNQVKVTDQAGKSRQSVTDAVGRLIKVVEDPEARSTTRLLTGTTRWAIWSP